MILLAEISRLAGRIFPCIHIRHFIPLAEMNSKLFLLAPAKRVHFNHAAQQWTTCIIDFGPLSMTVGGCMLLPNEMAAVGVGISFRGTLQRILNYLLHRSASLLLREITRELFAIL